MLSLRDRIRNKIHGGGEFKEEDIIEIHDALMVEYGWIPVKEFRELYIPTMLNLIQCIKKRHEREKKSLKMPRRGRR